MDVIFHKHVPFFVYFQVPLQGEERSEEVRVPLPKILGAILSPVEKEKEKVVEREGVVMEEEPITPKQTEVEEVRPKQKEL